ncbi:conserved hypothetical protein [Neospora caninum Liverpool]|uniref:Myb-like domain-containing protein n=1 Tax=Neospora caninum (strain Liverpool) TaxID=572307 RepID=F0VGS1_NEOCL|nr:conserved hypothetical protein [Neospora caninum Liverpool]CBZ52915.1 conserved hypothetical protein [Neospora caninum Liverpool]CEL66897.1 TPA: hypothetical protein BN1204_027030 [Neospora caninum Liverpool]|eukprot:XP_003882947.1 conserved hypothetical protein [Neospora caninum Liverpool]
MPLASLTSRRVCPDNVPRCFGLEGTEPPCGRHCRRADRPLFPASVECLRADKASSQAGQRGEKTEGDSWASAASSALDRAIATASSLELEPPVASRQPEDRTHSSDLKAFAACASAPTRLLPPCSGPHAVRNSVPADAFLVDAFAALLRSMTEPIQEALRAGDISVLRGFLSPLSSEAPTTTLAPHPLSFSAFSRRSEARRAVALLRKTSLDTACLSPFLPAASARLSASPSACENRVLPAAESFLHSLARPALATLAFLTTAAWGGSAGCVSSGNGKRKVEEKAPCQTRRQASPDCREVAPPAQNHGGRPSHAETAPGVQTAESPRQRLETGEEREVDMEVLDGGDSPRGRTWRGDSVTDADGLRTEEELGESEADGTEGEEAKRQAALRVFLEDRIFLLVQIAAVKIALFTVASATAAAVEDMFRSPPRSVSSPASASSAARGSAAPAALPVSVSHPLPSVGDETQSESGERAFQRGDANGDREKAGRAESPGEGDGRDRDAETNKKAREAHAKQRRKFLDLAWWLLLRRVHEVLELTRALAFASSPLAAASDEAAPGSQPYPATLAALECRVKLEENAGETDSARREQCGDGGQGEETRPSQTPNGTGRKVSSGEDGTEIPTPTVEAEDEQSRGGQDGQKGEEARDETRNDQAGGTGGKGVEDQRRREDDREYLDVRERLFHSVELLGRLMHSLKELQRKTAATCAAEPLARTTGMTTPRNDRTSCAPPKVGTPCDAPSSATAAGPMGSVASRRTESPGVSAAQQVARGGDEGTEERDDAAASYDEAERSCIFTPIGNELHLLCRSIALCFELWPSLPSLQVYERLLLSEGRIESSLSCPSPPRTSRQSNTHSAVPPSLSSDSSSSSVSSPASRVSPPVSSSSSPLRIARGVSGLPPSSPAPAARVASVPHGDAEGDAETLASSACDEAHPAVFVNLDEEVIDANSEEDREEDDKEMEDKENEDTKETRQKETREKGDRTKQKDGAREASNGRGDNPNRSVFSCGVRDGGTESIVEDGEESETDWYRLSPLRRLAESAKQRVAERVYVEENVFFLLSHLHQVASEQEAVAATLDFLAKQGNASRLFLLPQRVWTPWQELRALRIDALSRTQANIKALWREKDLWGRLLHGMASEARRTLALDAHRQNEVRDTEAQERRRPSETENERRHREAAGQEGVDVSADDAPGAAESGASGEGAMDVAANVDEERDDANHASGHAFAGGRREDWFHADSDETEGEKGDKRGQDGNEVRSSVDCHRRVSVQAPGETEALDARRLDASPGSPAPPPSAGSSRAAAEACSGDRREVPRQDGNAAEMQAPVSQRCARERTRGREEADRSCDASSSSWQASPSVSFSPAGFSSAAGSSSRGLREALLAFWSWGGSGAVAEEKRRGSGVADGPTGLQPTGERPGQAGGVPKSGEGRTDAGKGGDDVQASDRAGERETRKAREVDREDGAGSEHGEDGEARGEEHETAGGKERDKERRGEEQAEEGAERGGVSDERGETEAVEPGEESGAIRMEEQGDRGETAEAEKRQGGESGSEEGEKESAEKGNGASAEAAQGQGGRKEGRGHEGEEGQTAALEQKTAIHEEPQDAQEEVEEMSCEEADDMERRSAPGDRRKRRRSETSGEEDTEPTGDRNARPDDHEGRDVTGRRRRTCRSEGDAEDVTESRNECEEHGVPGDAGEDATGAKLGGGEGDAEESQQAPAEAEVDDETALRLSSCFWQSGASVVVADSLLSAAADLVADPAAKKRLSSTGRSSRDSAPSSSSSSSLASALARVSPTLRWKDDVDVKPRSLLDPHPGERREEWDSDSLDNTPEHGGSASVRRRGKEREADRRRRSSRERRGGRVSDEEKENASNQLRTRRGARESRAASWSSSDEGQEGREEAHGDDLFDASSRKYQKYRDAVGEPDHARQILNARHPGAGPVCRPQRKWQAADEQLLVAGVNMFGVGKWNEVHKFFPPLRRFSPPQLKDKFRILQKLLFVSRDSYHFIE